MKAANRNTLWARIFVEELSRAGLRFACIAPGSRSTPLALAFAGEPGIRVFSVLDERSAAFFALGLGLQGNPAALLCTSGTAAANLFPAIVEANTAQVPLLALTADRPHELRDSGSNQTIDQVKLYGDHVRWFVDVEPPPADPTAKSIRSLRSLASRSMARAAWPTPGPVHLNFPFRKPLEPIAVAGEGQLPAAAAGRADGGPYVAISAGRAVATESQIDLLAGVLQRASRGLIVCGPRCAGGAFPEAVAGLAQATGFPIFADPLSGVRFGSHLEIAPELIFAGYDTALQPAAGRALPAPEVLISFGAVPTSRPLGEFLERLPAGTQRVAIQNPGNWHDDGFTTSSLIWADPELTCKQLADRLNGEPWVDQNWVAAYRRMDAAVWEAIEQAAAEEYFEGLVLADIIAGLPAGGRLQVASSLPVRHLDQFVPSRSKRLEVFANRGASGIDGTMSTAFGVAAAAGEKIVVVLGDLAFYHDLNALLAIRRCGVRATIIVINNEGGGIFHRLPISAYEPAFTELFLTPHGLDLSAAGNLFDLPYYQVRSRQEFQQRYREALASADSEIIEVRSDARRHERARLRIVNLLDSQPL